MGSRLPIDLSKNPLDDGFIPTQKWFVYRISKHVKGLTLDCGCGRGLWSKMLREKGIDIVGLDLSLRRLKLSKSRNDESLVRGSCNCLPFREDSFDSVLLIEVIEHLRRNLHDTTLQEVSRVLKTDGPFVMTTPNKYIYSLLTRVGLFEHNPEHLGELTHGQAKALFTRYFDIIDFTGKASSRHLGRFLDYFLPTILRWDLLFVGKKARRREDHFVSACSVGSEPHLEEDNSAMAKMNESSN